MHWTFEQHLASMRQAGVQFEPRLGDGRRSPWRDPAGRPPRRDARREVEVMQWYLGTQPAGYMAEIQARADALPPMAPSCRASVLIPARHEGAHVDRILTMLVDQRGPSGARLDRGAFEIVVLENTVEGEPEDDTAARVKAWQAVSDVPLHLVHWRHPVDEPSPLTISRKVLADVAIARAAARRQADGPYYMISEDCDILWMDPQQVATCIGALDADPGLDAVRGVQDRCPWVMARHPLLLVMRRSWNLSEAYLARRDQRPGRAPQWDYNWNRLVTSGWNTAFTGEVYAQIAGYTPDRLMEEDMDIGERISCLRAYEQDGRLIPQVNTTGPIATRSEGSVRRWLYWAFTELEPYIDANDYDNFLGLHNEEVVKLSPLADLEQRAASFTRLSVDRVAWALGRDLAFLVKITGDVARAHAIYQRVLTWLGFRPGDVELVGEEAKVKSIDEVVQRVDAYAARTAGLEPGPYPERLPRRDHLRTWRTYARPAGTAPWPAPPG